MLKKRSITFKKSEFQVGREREALLNTSQSFSMLSSSHDCSPKLFMPEDRNKKMIYGEKSQRLKMNKLNWSKSCSWINFYDVLDSLFDLVMYSYLIEFEWIYRCDVVGVEFCELQRCGDDELLDGGSWLVSKWMMGACCEVELTWFVHSDFPLKLATSFLL
jgi:hypothetical protein